MFLSKIVSATAIFIYGAQAGLDMAKCAAGFDWNKNTLGQDPCAVGSMLDASCRGLVEYTYLPLNSTQYYLPPNANNFGDVMCDCNTVMYSLYMACASCQGGQIYSWTQWIPQCDKVYVTQYPGYLVQQTAVPFWAYYDVTSLPNQTWSGTVAMSIGQGPQGLLGRQVNTPEPSTNTPRKTPTPITTTPIITTTSITTPSITASTPSKTTSIRNLGQPSGSSPKVPTSTPVTSVTPSPTKTTSIRNLGQPSGSSPKVPTPTNSPAGSTPNNGPMETTPTIISTGPTLPNSPVGSTPTNIPMETTSPNNPVESTSTNIPIETTSPNNPTPTNSQGIMTTTSTGPPQPPNTNNQNGGKNIRGIFGAVSSMVPLAVLILLVYI